MNSQYPTFIVDDDDDVREALSALLRRNGLTVETFCSAREFLDSYDPRWLGCILLDIQMPEMDGLELQKILIGQSCRSPIIIITGGGSIAVAVTAMKQGAFEFIEKPFKQGIIINTIHRAWAQISNGSGDNNNAELLDRLTKREYEILIHVIAGMQSKVIAYELGISRRTIEVHRARIMEKLAAKNISHLIRIALSAGVTPDVA